MRGGPGISESIRKQNGPAEITQPARVFFRLQISDFRILLRVLLDLHQHELPPVSVEDHVVLAVAQEGASQLVDQ